MSDDKEALAHLEQIEREFLAIPEWHRSPRVAARIQTAKAAVLGRLAASRSKLTLIQGGRVER